MSFRGCTSCFACKRKGTAIDKCTMKDDLETILQKICECDALILGSPTYFSSVTGETRPFLERLLFPYSSYEGEPPSFGEKINTAFIYTMNAPAFALTLIGYSKLIRENKKLMIRAFGRSESLAVTSTYQFDDYSKYAIMLFDGTKWLKRRETVFVEGFTKHFAGEKALCKINQCVFIAI